MNIKEASHALRSGELVWIEIDEPPTLGIGRITQKLDGDFFYFRKSGGIINYVVHYEQIHRVKVRYVHRQAENIFKSFFRRLTSCF